MARVLIVEDQPDIRNMLRLRLELYDHQVEEAENGRQGVDMAMAHPYDMILMDMHMPVMDGHAAVRELRRRHYPGPVVAVTASAMVRDAHQALEEGCDAFIMKPIGEDFEERIQSLLDRKEPTS